MADFVGATER